MGGRWAVCEVYEEWADGWAEGEGKGWAEGGSIGLCLSSRAEVRE